MSENNVRNLVLAFPNVEFAEGLKKHLERKDNKICETVVVLEHLLETLEGFEEDGTNIEGIIISSAIGKKLEDKRLELVSDVLMKIREKYSTLNIVVLANEQSGHPFLAELVQMGIYNIFVRGKDEFSIDLLEEVLNSPKPFSFVSKHLNINSEIRWRHISSQLKPDKEEVKEENDEEAASENEEKREKVKQEKIINKNYIKRNYSINVQNTVEKVVGYSLNRKLVLMGSVRERTGTTFISHLLADLISSYGVSVSYIENPYKPAYIYDRLYGHKKAPNYISPFFSTQEDSNKSAYQDSTSEWVQENIQWVVKNPRIDPSSYSSEDIDLEFMSKLLLGLQSTVTILDVGTDWDHPVFKELMDIANHMYLVVEPDLPLFQHFIETSDEKITNLRELHEKEQLSMVGNRFSDKIKKYDVTKDFAKDIIGIPNFDIEDVFKVQNQGESLFHQKKYQEVIQKKLEPIAADILSKEFIKKQSKSKGLLKNLFKTKSLSIKKDEEDEPHKSKEENDIQDKEESKEKVEG